jgi:hypothetical protein
VLSPNQIPAILMCGEHSRHVAMSCYVNAFSAVSARLKEVAFSRVANQIMSSGHISAAELNRLQANTENIRNICILAHVDHGSFFYLVSKLRLDVSSSACAPIFQFFQI